MQVDNPIDFANREVIDQQGHKLGTVSDVVSDNATLEPRWLVVDMGLLKTSHYVPVEGAFRTAEGKILVPFTKETVKHAGKAHGEHVLSADDERELCEYYGLRN